jgi:hypothetical protein
VEESTKEEEEEEVTEEGSYANTKIIGSWGTKGF